MMVSQREETAKSSMANGKARYRDLILDRPFDLIDRLFPTERASIAGVAVIMAGLSWLLYWREGVKETKSASVLAVLALIALVASFLNEGAREIWIICAIVISVLAGSLAYLYGTSMLPWHFFR